MPQAPLLPQSFQDQLWPLTWWSVEVPQAPLLPQSFQDQLWPLAWPWTVLPQAPLLPKQTFQDQLWPLAWPWTVLPQAPLLPEQTFQDQLWPLAWPWTVLPQAPLLASVWAVDISLGKEAKSISDRVFQSGESYSPLQAIKDIWSDLINAGSAYLTQYKLSKEIALKYNVDLGTLDNTVIASINNNLKSLKTEEEKQVYLDQALKSAWYKLSLGQTLLKSINNPLGFVSNLTKTYTPLRWISVDDWINANNEYNTKIWEIAKKYGIEYNSAQNVGLTQAEVNWVVNENKTKVGSIQNQFNSTIKKEWLTLDDNFFALADQVANLAQPAQESLLDLEWKYKQAINAGNYTWAKEIKSMITKLIQYRDNILNKFLPLAVAQLKDIQNSTDDNVNALIWDKTIGGYFGTDTPIWSSVSLKEMWKRSTIKADYINNIYNFQKNPSKLYNLMSEWLQTAFLGVEELIEAPTRAFLGWIWDVKDLLLWDSPDILKTAYALEDSTITKWLSSMAYYAEDLLTFAATIYAWWAIAGLAKAWNLATTLWAWNKVAKTLDVLSKSAVVNTIFNELGNIYSQTTNTPKDIANNVLWYLIDPDIFRALPFVWWWVFDLTKVTEPLVEKTIINGKINASMYDVMQDIAKKLYAWEITEQEAKNTIVWAKAEATEKFKSYKPTFEEMETTSIALDTIKNKVLVQVKQNPELANQILKQSLAENTITKLWAWDKITLDILWISALPQSEAQIAIKNMQGRLDNMVTNNNINVADMVHSLYAPTSKNIPVVFWYTSRLNTPKQDINIDYIVPDKLATKLDSFSKTWLDKDTIKVIADTTDDIEIDNLVSQWKVTLQDWKYNLSDWYIDELWIKKSYKLDWNNFVLNIPRWTEEIVAKLDQTPFFQDKPIPTVYNNILNQVQLLYPC